MSKTPQEATVDTHFVGKDSAIRRTYDQLLTELRNSGRSAKNRKRRQFISRAPPRSPVSGYVAITSF